MPIEQADNTRVELPRLISRPQKPRQQQTKLIPKEQDQLWDADRTEQFRRMQDFTNNNFWNYGAQTNYDPRTQQGQVGIKSNFDYAKSNVQNFGETLVTTGIAEGVGEVAKWATTTKEIGKGAEAIVESSPASAKVIKTTTIPPAEMHIRNQVPGAVKATYLGTSNGLSKYAQSKVRILTQEQIAKAAKQLEKLMTSKGWRKINHPNLQGPGFTNGKWVISDLKQGNIGRDWLGRIRIPDFAIETPQQFRLAMQRKGGRLINKN